MWLLRCIDDSALPLALSRDIEAPVLPAVLSRDIEAAPVLPAALSDAEGVVVVPVAPVEGATPALSLTEPVCALSFFRLHPVATARVNKPASATRNSRWGSR